MSVPEISTFLAIMIVMLYREIPAWRHPYFQVPFVVVGTLTQQGRATCGSTG
jgi:hypothetical protein